MDPTVSNTAVEIVDRDLMQVCWSANWTFVVVTDRVELDDQIAKTFKATGAVSETEGDLCHAGMQRKSPFFPMLCHPSKQLRLNFLTSHGKPLTRQRNEFFPAAKSVFQRWQHLRPERFTVFTTHEQFHHGLILG